MAPTNSYGQEMVSVFFAIKIQVSQIPVKDLIEGLSQQVGQAQWDLAQLGFKTKACWDTLEQLE